MRLVSSSSASRASRSVRVGDEFVIPPLDHRIAKGWYPTNGRYQINAWIAKEKTLFRGDNIFIFTIRTCKAMQCGAI